MNRDSKIGILEVWMFIIERYNSWRVFKWVNYSCWRLVNYSGVWCFIRWCKMNWNVVFFFGSDYIFFIVVYLIIFFICLIIEGG